MSSFSKNIFSNYINGLFDSNKTLKPNVLLNFTPDSFLLGNTIAPNKPIQNLPYDDQTKVNLQNTRNFLEWSGQGADKIKDMSSENIDQAISIGKNFKIRTDSVAVQEAANRSAPLSNYFGQLDAIKMANVKK